MNSLSGKTALITGGSKGLGKSIALALGAAGARVLLVARDPKTLQSAAEEVKKTGAEVATFSADVSVESEVLRLEREVGAIAPKIQILIHSAGINIRKPLVEFSFDEWRKVLDTNLTAVFLVCRRFVPLMKGQGYGRIISMTSILTHVALAGRTAYCASKAGLLGFTKALALELAPDKITVNGISPGPFATELNLPILQNPQANRDFLAKVPMGRWGDPSEVARLALYLCSEEAGFITGTDVVIDGGWMAQ